MPNKKKPERRPQLVAAEGGKARKCQGGKVPMGDMLLAEPAMTTLLPYYVQRKWTLPAIFSEAIKSSFDSRARWNVDVRRIADLVLERGLVIWLHIEPQRVAETVADISRSVLRNICAKYDSTTETLAIWDRHPESPEEEDEAETAN